MGEPNSTYFAFDEATGIGVEQNDPWKWCQETCDKVKDDGTVVYIAGPDPSLANNTSIFPNLEQNQAFVMTRHLPVMGREGRVIVLKFGYSNLKTLPTVTFCLYQSFIQSDRSSRSV